MSNMLRFDLEPRDHPYPNHPSTALETWGHVAISILLEYGKLVNILTNEWSLDSCVEWFIESYHALAHSDFSIDGHTPYPGESLAQTLNRFRSREFDDDDREYEWADAIFTYYKSHSLRFAFPGTKMPNIIVGLKHGEGEISFSDEGIEWAYPFDMNTFINTTHTNALNFLEFWSASQNPELRNYVRELITRLHATGGLPRSAG
jgi:hypothetical protein